MKSTRVYYRGRYSALTFRESLFYDLGLLTTSQQLIDEVISDAFKNNDVAPRGKILQCEPAGSISLIIYLVYWNADRRLTGEHEHRV